MQCNSLFYSYTMLTCMSHLQVPSYMSEFVMVTAWVQENGMHLYPNTDIGGKYTVLSNGELYINNAGPSDAIKSYTCRTVNRLTGTYTHLYYIIYKYIIAFISRQVFIRTVIWWQ